MHFTVLVEDHNSTQHQALSLEIAREVLAVQSLLQGPVAAVQFDGVPRFQAQFLVAQQFIKGQIHITVQIKGKVLFVKFVQSFIVHVHFLDDAKEVNVFGRQRGQLLPVLAAQYSSRAAEDETDAGKDEVLQGGGGVFQNGIVGSSEGRLELQGRQGGFRHAAETASHDRGSRQEYAADPHAGSYTRNEALCVGLSVSESC